MTVCTRIGQWAGMLIGLGVLWTFFSPTAAADVWGDTVGQNWFYESRAWSGQTLSGRHWVNALEPGKTYRIRFQVNQLDGAATLAVGERSIAINREGWHSYDFKIWHGSKRKMLFRTRRHNVTAGISDISVDPRTRDVTSSGSHDGGSNHVPKGHYLSFARERNLQSTVMALLDNPGRARSSWHLNLARDVHSALGTPGVRGFWMSVYWRTLEPGDGRFDWSLLDANMAVAQRLGLKFVVKVQTRGFEGEDVTPRYFPDRYKVWSQSAGMRGFVAKIWDPWVRTRLIRLHRQIAQRYANNPAFGGIASTESAVGNFSGGNYSLAAFRQSLEQIATETQQALQRGKYFWYLNFVRGGMDSDMRRDVRVQMVNNVPHHSLVVGAPDITPDLQGVPGSLSSYRVHLRNARPHVEQFCHMQHVDQGLGGRNRKTNRHRQDYLQRVRSARQREQQPWFDGPPGVYVFDDLRDPRGRRTDLHPDHVLGQLWHPSELFRYADRNFDCDYFFWHYRENVHNLSSQFWWEDIRPVIVNNQNFHQ